MPIVNNPPNDPYVENQAFLSGQGPAPNQAPTISSGATSGGEQLADSAPVSSNTVESAPTSYSPSADYSGGYELQFSGPGNAIDRIYNTLGGETQKYGGILDSAVDNFYEQAGAQRDYQGIGGQDILSQAIGGTGDIEQARGLANASYSGPTGLDSQATDQVYGALSQIRPAGQGLYSGRSLSTLLRQAAPGLSSGEARQEAQSLSQDAGHRQRSQGINSQINSVNQRLNSESQKATDYASARGAQEDDIRTQSRDYLAGQRSEVTGSINDRINEANAQTRALTEGYQNFQTEGTVDSLQQIDGLGFDPTTFNTQARSELQDALNIWDQIMTQDYGGIQDQELLQLGVDSHGKETPKLWDTPDDVANRQAALASYFSPGTRYQSRGDYFKYRPLYYAGDPVEATWQPADIRNYVTFDAGTEATRGNQSTEEERGRYNRIQDILGEIDRIDSSGEPFRAAAIAANLDQFLAEEEAELANRANLLDAEAQSWSRDLNRARRDYKKAQRQKDWGKVGKYLSGVFMGPGAAGVDLGDVGDPLWEAFGQQMA